MQAIKKNIRKFSLLVCIIVSSAAVPVHGQFVRTYFKLTPGIQAIHLENQAGKGYSFVGTPQITSRNLVELRGIENLEIMIEVSSVDNNVDGLSPSILLYGNYLIKTLTPQRHATFVLKKNGPNKSEENKTQPFTAMLGLPQNTKGLIIIHHP